MSKTVKFSKCFWSSVSMHVSKHQALYCGVVIHFSRIDVLIVLRCILSGSGWESFFENIVLLSNFEDKPKITEPVRIVAPVCSKLLFFKHRSCRRYVTADA